MHKKRLYKATILIFSILIVAGLFLNSFVGSLRVFLPHIFQVTGFLGQQKNYLIIFQNNTELRPTGGFISAFGILRFKNGIPSLEMRDVYGEIADHEFIEPPYPQKQLLTSRWYGGYTFRDANWNPKFSESAEDLISFYNKTNDEEIQGVIAVNYAFLEDLIRSIDGISINGDQVTADTLFETLEHNVSNIDLHNEEALKNRKSVLGIVKKELAIRAMNPFYMRKISDTIHDSLNKKDIIFYFKKKSLSEFVGKNNWDGNFEYKGGDFLYINEANLGGAKSNRYITKDISYFWQQKDDNIEAKLTLDYQHHGIFNAPLSTDYSGYTRVYLPKEAEVTDFKAGNDPAEYKIYEESGYKVVGFILMLKHGEAQQIEIKYNLPKNLIKDGNYNLQVIKQPGDKDTTIKIAGSLTQGHTIKSKDFVGHEQLALYSANLESDLNLSLQTISDKTPPRVVHQAIKDLNTIEIHFNEPVNLSAANGFNYQVTDLNAANDNTDTVIITNISHGGRFVELKVEGMTEQDEEQYMVTIDKVGDMNGNAASPLPKTVTLVQRLGEE
ncbi:DUF4012 domain-containing protein [Patescibacteria group bacterium]|nr:DUF4012 domain-containing protein [Patescibacteria group bacterium]